MFETSPLTRALRHLQCRCTDAYLLKHTAVLSSHGYPTRVDTHADIKTRWPALSHFPTEWGAVWDPSGGILIASACVAAVQASFVAGGGVLSIGRVTAVSQDEQGAAATVNRPNGACETLAVDRVCVCGGAWTGRLFPDLARHLSAVRIPVTYVVRSPSVGRYLLCSSEFHYVLLCSSVFHIVILCSFVFCRVPFCSFVFCRVPFCSACLSCAVYGGAITMCVQQQRDCERCYLLCVLGCLVRMLHTLSMNVTRSVRVVCCARLSNH